MNKLAFLIPVLLASMASVTIQSASGPRPVPSDVYKQLEFPMDTSCCAVQQYLVISATFSLSTSAEATIFATVTVFQKSLDCCAGAFAYQLSIDNGPLHQIGGGDTSRFPGVRVTLSSFERVALSPGSHTVALNVYNGGGTWTIDSGPLTALLIEFDW